jgi:hypothetical protein
MIEPQYRMECHKMKTTKRFLLISILMLFTAPAYSAAIQLFNCELNGDATTDDVYEMASKWLKVAKTLKGGENMKVYIRHPVAASSDDNDFKFVLTTPTFAEWGDFTDTYEGSDSIAAADDEFEKIADCADSAVWEGDEIK